MVYTQARPTFDSLVELRDIVMEVQLKLHLLMDEDKYSDCSELLSSIYRDADELHKKAHYLLLNESERGDDVPCLLWADSKPSERVVGELITYLKGIKYCISAVSDGTDTVQRVMELWVEIDVFFQKVKKVCLAASE